MTRPRLPRLPRTLAAWALRAPRAVVIGAALGALLSLGIAAARLEFRFGHADLIAAGDRYRQLAERDRGEFEDVPGRVVVVIRGDRPDQAKEFATALARRWAEDPKIERVLYRFDLEPLKAKGLWYLSPADLASLHRTLAEHQDLLVDVTQATTLHELFLRLNRGVTTALVGRVFTGFLDEDDAEAAGPDLALVLGLLRELRLWLDGTRTYRSPWTAALGGGTERALRDGYLWSDDQRLLFVLADPRRDATEFNRFAAAVAGIRADLRDLQRGFPGLEVGLTGRAVIEADEMGVAQRDMGLATLVAVLGVAALFVAFFRGVVRPALATLTLLVGCAWSLGFTTLAIGHLNILTIVFMPMLVGLGDHSIHFIARFEEERAAGWPLPEALARTFAGTGMGIVAATGTTALAFAMLLLTGFKGLVELGVISAGGVLLTAAATLTLLPALLVLEERRRGPRAATPAPGGVPAGWGARGHRRPALALAASGLLVGLAGLAVGSVRFDFGLFQLQAQGTESIGWAQRIAAHTTRSVLFDEVLADSLEAAAAKRAALLRRPSVAEVDSILSVLPDSPESKRELIRGLGPLVAALPLPAGAAGPPDPAALRAALERLRFKMGDGEPAAPGSAAEEGSRRDRREVRGLIDEILGAAGRLEGAAARDALVAFQAELFRDLAGTVATLKRQPESEPVGVQDLPAELRARYVGRSGRYRLLVYPAENVWEFEPLTRFVADVQAVEPDAHGTPVTTFEYLRVLREGYTRAALYAVLAVAALALVTFRAVGPALLALLPVVLGAVWTLGLMGALGIPFNAANLLLLPLLVAVGIDNGMYVVHRFREPWDGPGDRPLLAGSAAKAITLASLTNIVGFGSLMLSSHRGIFSLGAVVALGVGCLWVASVVTLPSLLRLLDRPARAAGGWAGAAARGGPGAPRTYPPVTRRAEGVEGARP